MVRIERRVRPAIRRRRAVEALEDDPSAHGDDVGGAEGAVCQNFRCGEVGGLREEVEGGKEGYDVAIVDAEDGGVSAHG